jgi:transposase InsO family protein
MRDRGVAISMGGRGRWPDNVFVERPRRSVKHEEVYLKAYENHENLVEARRELRALSTSAIAAADTRGSRTASPTRSTGLRHALKQQLHEEQNPVQLSRPTQPPQSAAGPSGPIGRPEWARQSCRLS